MSNNIVYLYSTPQSNHGYFHAQYLQSFYKDKKDWSMSFSEVPLGSWDIQGNWEHNKYLQMTRAEQMMHNYKYGHFKTKLTKPVYSLVVDESSKKKNWLTRFFNWLDKE